MKTYTYTEARKRFSSVLEEAKREEVVIRRRNGDQFVVTRRLPQSSPFDVRPVRTDATTQDILEAVRVSRERP